jgi:glycosyltransferase involved in cell wall biosynthesis
MKVALLTDGIPPFVIGGMQKHSLCLARELVRLNVEVTLVHCVPYGAKAPDEQQVREALEVGDAQNLEQICLTFPQPGAMPGHYIRESWSYARAVYNRLKDRWKDFDLIYAKGLVAWALLDAKRKGQHLPPIAVKFHGYEMFQKRPNLRAIWGQYILRGPVRFNNRHADFVFSYGGKITDIIQSIGIPEDRIIEIPTGIEANFIREHAGEVHTPRRFVFIGRYERRKGINELHEALTSLDEVDFHIDFIGPIPASKRLKDSRCTYHGSLSDKEEIKAILDAGDVLVCPSFSEGMPNVIMEGLARGLAVIATDVGAVRQQVDETTGWLIEPGSIEAIKTALQQAVAINNEDLRQKQEAAIRRCRAEFKWETIGERHLEVMSQLIAHHE